MKGNTHNVQLCRIELYSTCLRPTMVQIWSVERNPSEPRPLPSRESSEYVLRLSSPIKSWFIVARLLIVVSYYEVDVGCR